MLKSVEIKKKNNNKKKREKLSTIKRRTYSRIN